MPHAYDDQNIFAKILRGELPCNKVAETEHSLAFHDIHPQAPVHVLVVPKGPYVCYDHFALDASDAEIVDYTRLIGQICEMMDVQPKDGVGGYRLISNAGEDAIQEVPHLHVHLVGKRPFGRILQPAK